jgi:hypothetical protein
MWAPHHSVRLSALKIRDYMILYSGLCSWYFRFPTKNPRVLPNMSRQLLSHLFRRYIRALTFSQNHYLGAGPCLSILFMSI